jgi:hypothetical protein
MSEIGTPSALMISNGTFSCCRIYLASLAFLGAVQASDCVRDLQTAGPQFKDAGAAYSLQSSGNGAYLGVNPRQRLTVAFDAEAVQLNHPGGRVRFHLAGYGRGDQLRRPAPAQLSGSGNCLEYRRGELTEWYWNGRPGLEQGFTLHRRAGTADERGPLVIALTVAGGLTPKGDGEGAVRFESGAGVVLRYEGLKAEDARGRVLPSRMEVREDQVRLIVEDADAEYPVIVDPTWTQQQRLVSTDSEGIDVFGTAVSVDGDTAVVGAWGDNYDRGAAHVFVRSGSQWTQQGAKLMASDREANDDFGGSVAVSGDTVVAGAPRKSNQQGAAYVFVRSGGVWAQQQKLTAPDAAAGDVFGGSVAVSGDTVVIGSRYKSAAYVFVRSGGVWTLQQKLTASDGLYPSVGASVALSGDTAVVGAPEKNSQQGAAYVFVRSGVVWSQQQKLTASDAAVGSNFGQSVSLSGDTALIGGKAKLSGQGAAYVFIRNGAVWAEQQRLTASDGVANDSFAMWLSVSGDTAAVGAPTFKGTGGAVYVFARSGGVWSQQTVTGSLTCPNIGNGVAVSGSTMVVGAVTCAYAYVQPTIAPAALYFVPMTPCRVADTRNANGIFGGPVVGGGGTRSFPMPQSICGIPTTAAAYSLNVTVVPRGSLGYLALWPTGGTQPLVSTLNSTDGRIKANAAIVPAGTAGAVSVYATDTTDVVLDIDGYFVPPSVGGASSLALYTAAPCRVADTRNAAGALGGPSLAASVARKFPMLQSGCNLPATAQAYSLNFTAVPRKPLGYLTAWPSDQGQPFVSTLNAPTGAIVANAAMVPAARDGGVSVFATDATDLVIDVNAYFAPPASGGVGALAFYAVTPCRVVDTRNAAGMLGGPVMSAGQVRTFMVPASACGIPSTAQAYSLNATVVPAGVLGYLTLWPAGGAQPLVSTLNALDGTITSNAAIVPAGTSGSISAFVTDKTELILDINGYFAPVP